MIVLSIVKRTDPALLVNMASHYSQPKGFVGRNICYEIRGDGKVYGHIVSGSSTKFLPGRDAFFGITPRQQPKQLSQIINNIFFHIEGPYPFRNFTQAVIRVWRGLAEIDWLAKYGDVVIGFESLVEMPRVGECYRRDGWVEVGMTKGYTCKRGAGKGTDSWSGKRIWDTKNLRPKRVFCRKIA